MSVHIFDPRVAKEYGITEAVIVQNFQFWISHNKRNQRHLHQGRTWTYNSARAMAGAFTYLSEKQIYGAICRLVKAGVLIKANFNDHKYDRTSWYAFADEGFWIDRVEEIHFPAGGNGKDQAGGPIPDTLTDNKPEEKPPGFSGLAPGAKVEGEKKKITVEKKPPAPAKEKRPPRLFWQAFVDTWHDFYVAHTHGEAPTIAGKNLADLGKLYDLLQLRARKKKADWSEPYMINAMKFFLAAAWSEDWLSKHFLLKNLVEQFDAIFAREAEKAKGQGQKRPVDLQYIIDRWFDGDLDDRILTPDIYKKLVGAKLIPEDHWGKFAHPIVPNATNTDAMVSAIKDWLKKQTKPTTA